MAACLTLLVPAALLPLAQAQMLGQSNAQSPDNSINMDMDLDNTTWSGYPVATNGDRSGAEERKEETDALRTMIDETDRDGDNVPGYADGIDKFGNGQANACWKFEPMVIELKSAPSGGAKFVFHYSASDPDAMTMEQVAEYRHYHLAPGVLRIWKKNGDEVRKPQSANDGGDFLQPEQPYTAEQLGIKDGSKTVTLYVEAVTRDMNEDYSSITLEFYPNGTGDATNVTEDSVKIDPYGISGANPVTR